MKEKKTTKSRDPTKSSSAKSVDTTVRTSTRTKPMFMHEKSLPKCTWSESVEEECVRVQERSVAQPHTRWQGVTTHVQTDTIWSGRRLAQAPTMTLLLCSRPYSSFHHT